MRTNTLALVCLFTSSLASPIEAPVLMKAASPFSKLINGLGSTVVLYSSYLLGKGEYDKHKEKHESQSSSSSVPAATTITLQQVMPSTSSTESVTDLTTLEPPIDRFVSVTLDLPSSLNNTKSGYYIPQKLTVAMACPIIRSPGNKECNEEVTGFDSSESLAVSPKSINIFNRKQAVQTAAAMATTTTAATVFEPPSLLTPRTVFVTSTVVA